MFLRPRPLANRCRAFTLTELAIVLGIMGIITGAIWAAANTMSENRKVSVGSTEVITIVHNVRELFTERQGFPDAGIVNIAPSIQNAGVFPVEMLTNVANPINPWGGPVAIYTNAGGANTFRVSFYNMTKMGCADVAAAVGARGTTSGLIGFGSWYSVTDPNTGIITQYGASNYITIPDGDSLDPVAAATACGGGADHAVSAEFDFSLQ